MPLAVFQIQAYNGSHLNKGVTFCGEVAAVQELTYRYKLEPTPEQIRAIRRHIGAVRFVYNRLLEDLTDRYRMTRQWGKPDASSLLKSVSFLKELDPGACAWAEIQLQRAYRNFFHALQDPKIKNTYRPEAIAQKRKSPSYQLLATDLTHYPRPKQKRTGGSYSTTFTDIHIENGKVFLPAVGNVKVRYHRPVPQDAQINYCTVVQKPTDKIFLLIHVCLPEIREKVPLETTLGAVFAEDLVLVRSDGERTPYLHQSKSLTEQIEQAQKTLRRRKKGSAGYEEARLRLAKLYEKRTSQRQDQLHKLSREMADSVDILYMRPPTVQQKLKTVRKAMRPEILDEAQYTLYQMLSYKTQSAGKQFWGTPAEWPAYEICSACGVRGKSLEADSWVCPSCGTVLSAHHNAALNMLALAEKYKKESQPKETVADK